MDTSSVLEKWREAKIRVRQSKIIMLFNLGEQKSFFVNNNFEAWIISSKGRLRWSFSMYWKRTAYSIWDCFLGNRLCSFRLSWNLYKGIKIYRVDNFSYRSRYVFVSLKNLNSQAVGVRYCLGCRKGLVSLICSLFLYFFLDTIE